MGFSWYKRLVRPWLFRLPPEPAQKLAEFSLSIKPLWRFGNTRKITSHPALSTNIAGILIPNPIGLAAGFDKQCKYLPSLERIGFGYLVGGTVTPERRPGNPKPRLLRYESENSLINSLGFPSQGLHKIAQRLRNLEERTVPLLISIAALDEEGFESCHSVLEPLVDAIELNISSPNTLGLRVFQEPKRLKMLLDRINTTRKKPLFVKLPPYVDKEGEEQVKSLLNACISSGVSGVTAGNTVPKLEHRLAIGSGGLSGHAIFPQMLKILRELRKEAGTSLVINACGGIFTGEDAWQALESGANTVQLYTGMVYQGTGIVKNICADLLNRYSA